MKNLPPLGKLLRIFIDFSIRIYSEKSQKLYIMRKSSPSSKEMKDLYFSLFFEQRYECSNIIFDYAYKTRNGWFNPVCFLSSRGISGYGQKTPWCFASKKLKLFQPHHKYNQIRFRVSDGLISEYVMKYPRPYDVVIFFGTN